MNDDRPLWGEMRAERAEERAESVLTARELHEAMQKVDQPVGSFGTNTDWMRWITIRKMNFRQRFGQPMLARDVNQARLKLKMCCRPGIFRKRKIGGSHPDST